MEQKLSDGQSRRMKRALNEDWAVAVSGPNSFVFSGDSGKAHVVRTDGTEAVECSCPDHEHNLSKGQKCKHMMAYEEWPSQITVVE